MTYASHGRRALTSLFVLLFCTISLILPTFTAHAKTSGNYQDRVHATATSLTGKGIVIGIFDGGLNVDSTAFKGRIVSQACVGGSDEVYPCETQDDREAHISCSTTDVGCFHGTAVAGFAAGSNSVVSLNGKKQDVSGIAPGASISYVRVAMTKSGTIPYSTFVTALQKFVDDARSQSPVAPDVVNLSLSFPRSSYRDCNANNEAKRLIDELVSMGVVVVAATGNNSNKSEVTYPACMDNVIAVGSTGFDGVEKVSDFSNSSPDVDIVAPGQNQWGMLPEDMRFLSVSGTSFATPLVSGAVALLKEAQPSLTPYQIKELLKQTGDLVLDPITGESYPELNVHNALVQLDKTSRVNIEQISQKNMTLPIDKTQVEDISVSSDASNVAPKKVVVEVLDRNQNTQSIQNGSGTILLLIALSGVAIAICSIVVFALRHRRISYAPDQTIEIEWVNNEELSDFDRWEIDLLMSSLHDGDPELVTE